MEQQWGNHENHDHVIDIPNRGEVATLGSYSENASNGSDLHAHESTTATNSQVPAVQSSLASSTNTLRSPSVYRALISIKLSYKISLIIASITVLVSSRHENPQNPLFAWILGYTAGSAASLPTVFRHYFLPHPRLCRLLDRFKWLLELYFAIWFVVGNYWVFGEKSSSEAHNLYRFCVLLLVLNYIKYIGPPILCSMILCCCRGFLNKIGGATPESINALPTYKFKLNKSRSCSGRETIEAANEGGVVAAGTEKERTLSGEDAVCCICLENYDDDDELKELPCSHFFHASCVDTWLKIKGFCPLCKFKVGKSEGESSSAADPSQQSLNFRNTGDG